MEIEIAAAAAEEFSAGVLITTANNVKEQRLVEKKVDGDRRRDGDGDGWFSLIMRRDSKLSVYLIWENVTVLLPSFAAGSGGHTKRLVNAITGFAQPGRIMAIMGPSGSGKSTLLDSLAGRLSGTLVMTGNVLFNGKKRKPSYGGLAYVTQEDIFLGTLTVRETMRYSAQLRLPTKVDDEKKVLKEIVEKTIMEMGLQDCADNMIGNWHLRGISGGEKKRLSIALEILTKPNILFLDEPTTGLDGASAFFVTQVLKNLAFSGKTIVSSIHQPSSEVFALFDDLLLLAGGEVVYFGEANLAVHFFADSGFPCPTRRNPSDHFIHCTNSDFDQVNSTLKESCKISVETNSEHITNMEIVEMKEKLIKNYKTSKYSEVVKAKVTEILSHVLHEREEIDQNRTRNQTRWLIQLATLTRRSFTNMSRDFGYYWLRILVYIVVSICVGTVFYDVGTNYKSILARGACGGFISGFMTFMSIGGFPCFIEEMKIFEKERFKGHYGVGVFILSNLISSLPFLILMTLCSLSITYFIAKFRSGFSYFIYAELDLLLSIAIVESCMMVVASIVPNFMMGIIVGAGFIGIMMAAAGFFRLQKELPKPFWTYPVSYINFMSWGLQGAYKNDLIGLEFDPPNSSDPKLKGEFILKSILGFSIEHSKWWDLAALLAILVCYRILFFVILKFKEKASPAVRTLYVNITLQHLSKRASFRKTTSFPSKRHNLTFHHLSYQEGLNGAFH